MSINKFGNVNLGFSRRWIWRIPSSGMLHCVAFVWTDILFLRSRFRLLVTANIVPSAPILVTMKIKAIWSSETSVLTRATQRHIQVDGILLILKWWLDLLLSPMTKFTLHYCIHISATVSSSLPLIDSGSQRRSFPFVCVPELSLPLSYWLLIATTHYDWITILLWLHQLIGTTRTA
jgi:hypothetical protein